MITKRWTRTDDIVGHVPLFKVECPFCEIPMTMRYSYLFPDGELIYGIFGAGNQVAYKCHSCGYHQRFNVEDDKEYIDSTLELRGGKTQYVPLEEWKQNEEIKKQLESLGYWG